MPIDNIGPDRVRPRGRPRKPQLIQTSEGWSLRYWRQEEGELVRRQVPLETASKVIARQRMKRILDGELKPSELGGVETFRAAAIRIVKMQNIASQRARLSRLERIAFPIIGDKKITAITSTMVKDVIAAGIDNAGGKCTSAVKHLFDDIQSVLGTLHSDDELPENVCKRIKFAKATGGIRRVRKPRIVLSDAEFVRFATYWLKKRTLQEVVVMAIASRFLGGMRTSDLHAWLWEHIDTVGWTQAMVPRPKTKKDLDEASPHAIDPQLAVVLRRWWEQEGRPVRGPVFPTRVDSKSGWATTKGGKRYWREGRRAGEPKDPQGVTYAKPLRRLLWEAGVIRPMPGYAAAEAQARALLAPLGFDLLERDDETGRMSRAPLGLGSGKGTGGERRSRQKQAVAARKAARELLVAHCEIQTGGTHNSRVDFHSFRRALATAAARAGLTPQEAMPILDHSDVSTHMRYVRHENVIVTPEKLLPRILAPQMAEIEPAGGSNHNDSQCVRLESNQGPVASEAAVSSPEPPKTPAKRHLSGGQTHRETPPNTGQRQNSAPVILAHADTLTQAIREALQDGDDELAQTLMDERRRRRNAQQQAAE